MSDISYDAGLTFFLNGNGDKYLADDGTYKAISIPAATTTTIGGIQTSGAYTNSNQL